MNKRWRAVVSTLNAIIMVVFAAGCSMPAFLSGSRESGDGLSKNPDFKDKMEISVALWGIDDALSPDGPDQFYNYLEKRFNLSIKPVKINWDDYAQKIAIWASTFQLPDIFSMDAVGTNYYRNWVKQELIKPVPEDLSRYPLLAGYLNKPDIQAFKEDGKLYFIPRSLYDSIKYCVQDRNVFYRWDLAREAGIRKEPETWEEFGDTLKAIMAEDPEQKNVQGLTFVNPKHISGLFWLYSNPAAASDGSGNDYKWIWEEGRYIPAVFSRNALPSLENLRGMYDRGIIDQNAVSNKGAQGYEMFATGRASAILMNGYGNLDTMVAGRWNETYPGKKLTDCIKRAPDFPATDGRRYQPVFKTFWSESYFSSQVGDKKLERILSLYDYMLSPEAKEFYRFGREDADFVKEGDQIIPLISREELNKKQRSAPILGSLVEFDDQFQYDPNNHTIDPDIRRMAADYIEAGMRSTVIPGYEARLTYLSTPAKDAFPIYDYEDMIRVMLSKEPVARVWKDIRDDYEKKGLEKMIGEVNIRAREMGLPMD